MGGRPPPRALPGGFALGLASTAAPGAGYSATLAMHPQDDHLRATWRALCADPTRDDLAAELAAAFERQLDAAIAALDRRPLGAADAVGEALRAALCLQLSRQRSPFRPGPYAVELRRRLAGDDAPDERGDPADSEDGEEPELDPADPFLPWRLGDRASEAPEPQRGVLLDAAIAAFDAIALLPIDPGNDLGPFTRIAELMTEAQVRRSIAVVERMGGAAWGAMEYAYAHAYLYARLAELGLVEEAESLLPRIPDPAIRAFARGRVLGHRIARVGGGALPPVDELPGERLHAFLSGLAQALPDPPASLVRACLDLTRGHAEPAIRGYSLETLAGYWSAVGPLAMWLPAVLEHATTARRISVMLDLAAAHLDDPDAPALVRAALAQLDEGGGPGPWIDEIVAVRVHVPDPAPLFARWMADAAQGPRSWLLRDLHYTHSLVELLRWLAGDAALAAGVRALDEVTALLTVPSTPQARA